MHSNQCFFFLLAAKLAPVWNLFTIGATRQKREQKMCAYPRFRIESRRFFSCVGLFLALALSPKLVAETSTTKDYRTLESHQHGLAELKILLEANRVQIEFESPAFNLVGFEHKASSLQEKKVVKNAIALLESPTRLIAFGGSACSPEATQIDASSVSNEEGEHDHEAEHEHEAEHDHEAKHQHEDEHAHEHETETSHADIIARYSFSCENNSDLSYIEINFFRLFSGLEKVKALWVGETGQGAMQLTASNRRLDLN